MEYIFLEIWKTHRTFWKKATFSTSLVLFWQVHLNAESLLTVQAVYSIQALAIWKAEQLNIHNATLEMKIEHVIEIQALGPCKYPYIRCSSFVFLHLHRKSTTKNQISSYLVVPTGFTWNKAERTKTVFSLNKETKKNIMDEIPIFIKMENTSIYIHLEKH